MILKHFICEIFFKDSALTKDAEALRLEDSLQRREVDDEELTHDGGQDGVTERPVAAQTHLVDHTSLRDTGADHKGCSLLILS